MMNARRFLSREIPAAAIAAALLLLPGCLAVAAGAAGGVVAHQAFLADDSYEISFRTEADRAFAIARGVVEDLDPGVSARADVRTLEGRVDGATVTVDVGFESKGLSRLVVKARRLGLAAQGTAKSVADRIARKVNADGLG